MGKDRIAVDDVELAVVSGHRRHRTIDFEFDTGEVIPAPSDSQSIDIATD
jgi:hypothetical protein